MIIPRTVRIGGYTYSIERPAESFVSAGSVCDGDCVFMEQRIRVASVGNSQYQQTVFLHEVAHAIIEHFCFGILSCDEEERFVEEFSKGLYAFISENQSVFTDGDKGCRCERTHELCRNSTEAKENTSTQS